MTKKLRIWLISIFVALAVPLVGVIGVAYMVNGEEICLDRHPLSGPPSSGCDDSCWSHVPAETSGIAIARQEGVESWIASQKSDGYLKIDTKVKQCFGCSRVQRRGSRHAAPCRSSIG